MDGATIETYRGTVYPWHCDHVGHMNVMWYVGKFDEATWQLFGMLGLTPQWLRERGRGMAALDQRIAYQRELRAGDLVVVRSALLEVRDKTLRFVHVMHDGVGGQVAAVTRLVGVCMDTTARRACALPDAVRERALGMLQPAFVLPWND